MTLTELKIRRAEIKLELAKMKSDYFNHGISAPMAHRATLEEDLQYVELEILKANQSDFKAALTRRYELKRRHNELMREKLAEVGMPHLWDDCLTQANQEMETV